MFRNEEEEVPLKKEKKNSIKDNVSKNNTSNEKFTDREKQFLYKKKLRTKSDILMDK
jgi:hypothetical protein